jgi:hypothetical protein
MSPAEYLTFIPLLFYGIALADLLKQWRRFFEIEHLYLPYFLATIMITEIAVWNIFLYLEVVSQLAEISYFRYWTHLLQPMIFLILVSALTSGSSNKDIEDYFRKRIPTVFGLMALFIASHFSFDSFNFSSLSIARLIGVASCLAIALTRKPSLIYFMAVIWIVSLLGKI